MQREESLPGSLKDLIEATRERVGPRGPRGPSRRPAPPGRGGRRGDPLRSLSLIPDAERGRALICAQAGLWLIDLERLGLIARLEREDIISAAFSPKGDVWTVHASGMVGRWTPGRSVIERVSNLPARPFAASIARDARKLALLCDTGRSREQPALMLCDLERGDALGEQLTTGATQVSLSADADRALTREERVLRVRDLSGGLSSATPTRSLLEPLPWLPEHVSWAPEANMIALCSTRRGDASDMQVILWG